MTYFADLSTYAYGAPYRPPQVGVLTVGWLDAVHPFQQGPVSAEILSTLTRLAQKPQWLCRGVHFCELCYQLPAGSSTRDSVALFLRASEDRERQSNGEIRVSRGGITYAAPVLIVHYIKAHQYLPPEPFLAAVADPDT